MLHHVTKHFSQNNDAILIHMKALTEQDIISLMREEWERNLQEKADIVFSMNTGGKETILIAPELKLQHRTSGLKYTVSSVSPRDVVLRAPEGHEFVVDADTLEKDYILE